MLKPSNRKMCPKKKAAALKFLAKEDMDQRIYVLVSERQYKKLKGELLKTKSSMTKWVREKIEEI